MCGKEIAHFHPFDVLTHVGPRLIPFFKTVVIYFVAWLPAETPSLFAAALKCLPICCLMGFVISQGLSLQKEHFYRQRIFIGLLFSCFGDALLIWGETYFLQAMGAFAIAHLAYISAFGFSSYRWLKGIPFFGMVLISLYLFYPRLQGLLLPCVCVYVWLICSMGWRAFAAIDILGNVWSWTSLCGVLGATFFMLSDFIIGFDKFVAPVPISRLLIMSSYYIAQLFMAMSAVNKTNIRIRMKKNN
ncbi:lysoplasmalogenase TMEM86A isoform X1 [Hydra vulgaris]|nr:lysoplasmalogenase-like protein TMEM86A [Hydra vulgaris]XP_012555912.1 lysoplasmalogenase-like protein TMEM86A [Hydra vulgaris]